MTLENRPSPCKLTATRPAAFKLGEFHIDFERRRVFAKGKSQALSPKAMQVLWALAENAGRVIGRETFFARVWSSRCVSDDVLTQAIVELRRVLGDQSKPRKYIETIPKSGYRLLANPSLVPTGEPLIETDARRVDQNSSSGIAIWKLILAFANIRPSRAA